MTEDSGKRGDPGVDIGPLAMRIDQSVDGERMSQIVQAGQRAARSGGEVAGIGNGPEGGPRVVRVEPASPGTDQQGTSRRHPAQGSRAPAGSRPTPLRYLR